MRCWNCGRKVAKKAKACRHCEADLTEAPSAEEVTAVMELLGQMPRDILAEPGDVVSERAGAEAFANGILVGPCPSCESTQAGDCDADPEINDPLVGRWHECGHLWCTDCGKALTRNNPHCSYCGEDEKLVGNSSPDRARPAPPRMPLARASRTTSSARSAQRRRSTVRSGEKLL